MQGWFAQNPNAPTLLGDLRWDMHKVGRNALASNFARGGMSASLFAPNKGEAFRAAFRGTTKYGSPQHIKNLEFMAAKQPNNPAFKKALEKAQRHSTKGVTARGVLGKVGMGAVGIGFLALPAFMTPGGIPEKARATVGGAASFVGWKVGARVGLGIGSAIGGPLGGIIGTGVGALAGAIGVDEGVQALMKIPDNLVERERKRRNLNWVGDKGAFQTQNAHTMRQMSLQAMNHGMATARSAMGREAVMFHR